MIAYCLWNPFDLCWLPFKLVALYCTLLLCWCCCHTITHQRSYQQKLYEVGMMVDKVSVLGFCGKGWWHLHRPFLGQLALAAGPAWRFRPVWLVQIVTPSEEPGTVGIKWQWRFMVLFHVYFGPRKNEAVSCNNFWHVCTNLLVCQNLLEPQAETCHVSRCVTKPQESHHSSTSNVMRYQGIVERAFALSVWWWTATCRYLGTRFQLSTGLPWAHTPGGRGHLVPVNGSFSGSSGFEWAHRSICHLHSWHSFSSRQHYVGIGCDQTLPACLPVALSCQPKTQTSHVKQTTLKCSAFPTSRFQCDSRWNSTAATAANAARSPICLE